MKTTIAAVFLTLGLLGMSAGPFARTAHAAGPPNAMPSAINPSAHYLFFHHNYYVETKGPDGDCKYNDILKSFADKGYVVISAIRPKDSSVIEFGKKGAAEVRKLLAAGVPAENITVAGHSKGGAIVLQTSAELSDPNISYVVMAGCGIKGLEKGYPDFARLKGRFLSIYATSDKVAGSCGAPFALAGSDGFSGKEIVLESSAGHQLFFKAADLWLEPTIAWLAKGK